MISQSEELSLDFFHTYEPWKAFINSEQTLYPFLKNFLNRGDTEIKNLKKLKEEIGTLMNTKQDEAEKLIGEMSHFYLSINPLIQTRMQSTTCSQKSVARMLTNPKSTSNWLFWSGRRSYRIGGKSNQFSLLLLTRFLKVSTSSQGKSNS